MDREGPPQPPIPMSHTQYPIEKYPVGGRLSIFLPNWRVVTEDGWVLRTLQEGYKLEFHTPPPLSREPISLPAGSSTEQRQVLSELIVGLEKDRVIEKVSDCTTPGYYSRFFPTPKTTPGQWRAVLDLSLLNHYLIIPKFKMEGAEQIRPQMNIGEMATSVDLVNAYYHVKVHRASRKYLRFVYQGQVYQYRALPAGLSNSGQVFSRVISVVKSYAHMRGVTLHQFYDDWLLRAKTLNQAKVQTTWLVDFSENLGFVINYPKSELIPKQVFVFLGYLFDLVQGKVMPTPKRWEKLQRWLHQFLQKDVQTLKAWQKMVGLISATEKQVPWGRIHLRDLQIQMNQYLPGQPHTKVKVTPTCRSALQWWLDPHNVMQGVPLVPPPPTQTVHSDSSLIGWGGHCGECTASGVWDDKQSKLHINQLELLGAWYTMKTFQAVLQGQSVLLATDNTTVVAYLRNQGGTKSLPLLRLSQQVFQWLQEQNITLSVRHIPGRLNVWADLLSRPKQIIHTEWSLHPEVVSTLFRVLFRPMVDLFATKFNHKLPTYVSPIPDQGSWGVDAMSMSWDNMQAYAFPPTVMLPLVLAKFARTENCHLLLVAPRWPRQEWYTTILHHLVSTPIALGSSPTLLKQPQMQRYHPSPEVMDLHAWVLSSTMHGRGDFLKGQPRESPESKNHHPSRSMSPSGKGSFVGVVKGHVIHSKQLYKK